ncbi:MAG: glycosyltransferase [Deltaproteobacteria bacterium]
MARINILFMLPNFDTGGSEKLVIDIIRSLDKARFAPVLVVFFTGSYEKEYLKLGLPFYVVHEGGIRSWLSTFSFIRSIMKRHSIQVVNTHHTSPLIQGFLPCRVFSGAALVHTEHTKLSLDEQIHAKALFFEKLFLRKADAAVGISKGVCEYFAGELNVPKRKIIFIANGVDMKRFELRSFDRSAYRRALGINDTEALVGLSANFRPQKNHALLVNAIAILKREGRNSVKLLLCGSGPTLDHTVRLAKDLGVQDAVSFLGVRHDIPELMASLDVYCLPSHFEGLPFSALEAMAAGRPIVATDVPGTNEVVINGKNGLLVPTDDAQALAKALGRVLDDPELGKRLASEGSETVNGYSFDSMIEKYETLFCEMASVAVKRQCRVRTNRMRTDA